jgi:hypothetical protein
MRNLEWRISNLEKQIKGEDDFVVIRLEDVTRGRRTTL